ncbi:MAG: tetratricopeptide repeat protein [Acidobacteriota bacterium]
MAIRREQVVKTAEKFVARGKIEAAIREYRKVLGENPNDSTTLNRVGDLYARIERIDEAVKLFSQIAETYTKDGFFVKAIAIYKKIIKLDPTRLDVIENLAELYHRQGLVNEARTQYQALADYYLSHGNRGSALSAYERIADLEPDNPSHHVKLAELYQAEQLTEKAIGEYRTIAELMISHGHPEEAAKVYERALDIDSSDIPFITDAVLRLREAGHTGQAAQLLAAAVRRNPEAESVAGLVAAEESGAEQPPAEAPVAEPSAAAVESAPPVVEAPSAVVEEPDEAVADFEIGLEESLDFDLTLESPPEGEGAVAAPAADERDGDSSFAGVMPEADEIELDLDDVFVLDLDAEEPPASLVQPPEDLAPPAPEPAAAAPVEEPVAFEVEPLPDLSENFFEIDDEALAEERAALREEPAHDEIDEDFLERTAAELQPAIRQEDDLFTEAEVLAKYGLEEKAYERLQDVLKIAPQHMDAMALMVRLDLDAGRGDRVLSVANQLAGLAAGVEDSPWPRLKKRLQSAGYHLEGDLVVAPETAAGEGQEEVGQLLEGLLDGPRKKPVRKAKKAPQVDQTLADLASEFLSPAATAKADEAEPEPVKPASADEPLAAEALREEMAEVESGAGGEVEISLPDEAEDSGVRWLDEVPESPPSQKVIDDVFDDEDDFFDLAAELEQELDEEEARLDALEQPSEPSLEEIVEGFKQGVAENLSAEDYDTHFNLGIAYREMGLLDEAIGEFQLASKDPGHLVECCSMLGLSFLEKGLPELAVKWYRRGLEAPDLTEEDSHGLLYDLGNVYLSTGDLASAHQTYVEIYGTNSNYRDVVAKLEEIAARSE